MDEQTNPYEAPQAPIETTTAAGIPDTDARMWAMICHLSALAGYTAIPLGNVLGPLVVWQIKKDQSPFVDDQGKEALNFQISMTIYIAVAALSVCIGIGIVALPVVGILGFVFTIIAGVKANQGEFYRYPLTIRMV